MRPFNAQHSLFSLLSLVNFSNVLTICTPNRTPAQSSGTVTDSTGAVIPGAVASIQNPVSAYVEDCNNRRRWPFPILESAV